jgi:glycosyltransferase involved in cell wall biosynthesis
LRYLFVSTFYPKDFRSNVHGVFKRMNMFIDAIKEISHLDVLFYVHPDIETTPSTVAKMQQSLSKYWKTDIRLFLCPVSNTTIEGGRLSKFWFYYGARAFSFFKQSNYGGTSGEQQVRTFEECLEYNPDAIFVHRLYSMPPLLLTHTKLPRVYLDLDDIEHISFRRSTSQLPKWYEKILNYMQLPALLLNELRAIKLADKTFVCSELDRSYLRSRWRLTGIVTVPNAITIPEPQPLTLDPILLFIGSYGYKPNVDAAKFLIDKIWPKIKMKIPEAKLIIAGSNPKRINGYDNNIPGVTFTGFVDDLEGLYREARIVCAPILSGGGTRIKIIEAAAYGKPIVTTRIGAEGLEMRDGHELFLRDDPEAFAQICLQLLDDYLLCNRVGSAARNIAIQHYDKGNILGLIQRNLN